MGSYVSQLSPESFSLGINDAMAEVTEQISGMKTFADGAYALLTAKLDDMSGEIASASLPVAPVDYDHINEDITIDDVGSRPVKPNFDQEFNAIRTEQKPIKGEIVEVDIPEFPTIPTFNIVAPTETFTYEESPYVSGLADLLFSSISSMLSDDGDSYAESISNAIYLRELSRLDEIRNKAYIEAAGFYPSRGWNTPNLTENALRRQVNIEYLRSTADLQNKLMELQHQLKLDFVKFSIESAIEYEKVLRDFFQKVAARAFEQAKTTVALIYDIYGKKVDAYRIRMEGVKTEVDALKVVVDAKIGYNKNIADLYTSDVTGYKALIDALLGVVDSEAKVYAVDGSVFGEVSKVAIAELNARVDKLRARIAQNTDLTGLKIKETEVRLQAYLQTLNLSADVSKAIATILAQIVASALGAVNTHLGKSDDVNRSISERHSMNQSISNSLGESHSYDETK